MSQDKFWHETLHADRGQYFSVGEMLYHEKTAYQELMIFDNAAAGRVMALDGVVQTTEHDEFIYHEMMVHVPLLAHARAESVLIIGGGDGGILREVCRHPQIQKITMVEIDIAVIELCRNYLPGHSNGAYEDPRFRLIISNAADFVHQSDEKFDVIISDSTDPIGPGKSLFSADFYQNCASRLRDGGIFVGQNGVCFLQLKQAVNSYARLSRFFADVSFYQAAIPSYYGGVMTFAWASQSASARETDRSTLQTRFAEAGLKCRYYNPAIHSASFALPQYFLDALEAECAHCAP